MNLDDYKAAIEQNFPEFKIKTLEKLGEGWDNIALAVNGDYIFRFSKAPNEYLINQRNAEICLLPKLRPHVPVVIPDFEFIGEFNGTKFVGYQKIQGEEMTNELLSGLKIGERKIIFEELAGFIKELHSYPKAQAKQCGVWEETSEETYRRRFNRLGELKGVIGPELIDYLKKQFEYFFDNLVKYEQEAVLTHGDLGYDHILIDPIKKQISGIIDFGDIGISDPDRELQWFADPDYFKEQYLNEFLEIYNQPNVQVTREKLKFFHNVSPMYQILYALDHNDQVKLKSGIKDLQRNAQS